MTGARTGSRRISTRRRAGVFVWGHDGPPSLTAEGKTQLVPAAGRCQERQDRVTDTRHSYACRRRTRESIRGRRGALATPRSYSLSVEIDAATRRHQSHARPSPVRACFPDCSRRRRWLAMPPLRPASRASSLVHSCAVPFWCAAFPPLLAISRCLALSIDANPRSSLATCCPPSRCHGF